MGIKQKYELAWGTHDGTLMGRDFPPCPEEFNSEEECRDRWKEVYKNQILYLKRKVWFAYIITPDNRKIRLAEIEPYHVTYCI